MRKGLMMMITLIAAVVLLLAWANGANDVSKGIASLVGGGVAQARRALWWGTLWTMLGGLTAHRLVRGLGRFPCRTHGDFVGIGAIVGLDAEKLPNRSVVAKQRDRPGPVVAKLDPRTDVYAGSDVINDSDRNGIEVGEMVHLLKNLQQDQQAQARGLPPRVSSPPL